MVSEVAIKRVSARLITIAGLIVFIVAVPPAIALSNFRWFVLEPGNYLAKQERNSVSSRTGLSMGELLAIDRGFVRYFQSDRDSLPSSLQQSGVVRSPFSDRDIAHMLDVYDMVRAALNLHWIAAAYAVFFLLVALACRARRLALVGVLAGSVLAIALLGLLGILSLFDWDAIFLQFHFLSFTNDLWRLDPARDALIRLFPPQFFMDTTVQLVVMSLAESLAVAALAAFLLRRPALRKWRPA